MKASNKWRLQYKGRFYGPEYDTEPEVQMALKRMSMHISGIWYGREEA